MIQRLFLLLVLPFLIHCSSEDKDKDPTAEKTFQRAEELEKDDRFEEALEKYKEVQHKFPYNRFSVLAKLRTADIHYKRENYIEAQNAYQSFKELHPKHQQGDYVTFRLALSYFQQLPGSIDRDLSQANKAILYFDEVLESYPRSEHVAEAKTKKEECTKMLAEKENYIAEFYFVREIYESALRRYEKLLTTYPKIGFDLKALYGASFSALKVGDQDKAKVFSKRLFEEFPNTSEVEKIKSELKSHGI